MADNDGTRYTTRGETDKLSLIEDRLHSCLPVIAIAFRGGALFATSSTIRGVRKVRLVHPKGLVFAGTGEVVAIQQIATGLTTGAHLLELRAGHTSVTAEAVIAQEELDGILGMMRALFVDSRTRPLIGDFLIAEVDGEQKRTVFHYLSATGDRNAHEDFCVLGGNDVVPGIERILKEHARVSQSRRDAVRLAQRAWEECGKEGTLELTVVSYQQPQQLQHLSGEEE
ncbi:MAG: hypothetical protein HY475_02150 [Candidatus Terrybacteria bacterium]|nr:hypothetical protein [Candidatus Terrybacteria bacterium]